MYSISLVDRTNLGLALVAGMSEDLELTVGNRYTILVMIFFVAYICFEIPSVGNNLFYHGDMKLRRDVTELGTTESWCGQLACILGLVIWRDSHRNGFHEVLGYHGPL
jgi:hypothetical protein